MSYKVGDWVEIIEEDTNDFGEVLRVDAVDSAGVYVEGVMGWTVYPEGSVKMSSADESAGPHIEIRSSKSGDWEYFYLNGELETEGHHVLMDDFVQILVDNGYLPHSTVFTFTEEEEEEDV